MSRCIMKGWITISKGQIFLLKGREFVVKTADFFITQKGGFFSSPEPKTHRLIGELIVYPCSVICPSSLGVHNFKRLLLLNHLANQSQILCGASLGRGNESLFAASGSHDQDGCHVHIVKTMDFSETIAACDLKAGRCRQLKLS